MRWFDRMFTRRLHEPCFDQVPDAVRGRLRLACRQLTGAENGIAGRMGLPVTPRLMLVDEELAVILTPPFRRALEEDEGPPAARTAGTP